MIAVHIVFEGPKALQIFELQKYLYIYMFIYISTTLKSHLNLLQKKSYFQVQANILFENGFTGLFFIRFQCWTHRQLEVCSYSLLISKN